MQRTRKIEAELTRTNRARAPSTKTGDAFPQGLLAALRQSKGLRLRAGRGDHRFIGIWFVMVQDRLFVRSWSVKPDGWYRTFLEDPNGTVKVAKYEIAVRARRVVIKSLRDEIDRAYVEKYNRPSEIKYAKDLVEPKCQATTTELVMEELVVG